MISRELYRARNLKYGGYLTLRRLWKTNFKGVKDLQEYKVLETLSLMKYIWRRIGIEHFSAGLYSFPFPIFYLLVIQREYKYLPISNVFPEEIPPPSHLRTARENIWIQLWLSEDVSRLSANKGYSEMYSQSAGSRKKVHIFRCYA